MASTGANVLRWSALGLGVAYGWYHQRDIYASDHGVHVRADEDRQTRLVAEAKRQYALLTAPRSSARQAGGVVTNIEDPNFDLEKALLKA